MTALNLSVYAARAHGLEVIDGVHLDLDDDAGLRVACAGQELGFDGKSLIHPKQIAATNAAFAPDEAELAQARAIIECWQQAEAEGRAWSCSTAAWWKTCTWRRPGACWSSARLLPQFSGSFQLKH